MYNKSHYNYYFSLTKALRACSECTYKIWDLNLERGRSPIERHVHPGGMLLQKLSSRLRLDVYTKEVLYIRITS